MIALGWKPAGPGEPQIEDPPEPVPPSAPESPDAATVDVVEYRHAAWNHYFMTADAYEVRLLDGGAFPDWQRTGRSFRAWPIGAAQGSPVCRFFGTAFAASSHFYTAIPAECAGLQASGDWQLEGRVFRYALPSPEGACASGLVPLYRLYNAGAGGAPNHRYTTDPAVRAAMLGQGWLAEGYGALGINGCVPP